MQFYFLTLKWNFDAYGLNYTLIEKTNISLNWHTREAAGGSKEANDKKLHEQKSIQENHHSLISTEIKRLLCLNVI